MEKNILDYTLKEVMEECKYGLKICEDCKFNFICYPNNKTCDPSVWDCESKEKHVLPVVNTGFNPFEKQ